ASHRPFSHAGQDSEWRHEYTERREMRVGRNDPCHCGSGLKFKKCHGAVIALHVEKRECGTCTACCDGWAIGTIYGHEMKPGVPRSEEHTSELQSLRHLVCRLLLEKKNHLH